MGDIAWKAEYETGVPFIDADHGVLLELLNQAHRTLDDAEELATLGSILNALIDYTEYHFTREEKLMELVGYENLEPHRATHRQLTEQVSDVLKRYESDPNSIRSKDVADFLDSWLIDHILGTDMEYRDAAFADPAKWSEAEAFEFDQIISEDEPELETPNVDWASLDFLAVDDNVNFQVMLQTLLKALGVVNMRCVGSAEAALESLAKQPANVVLCDWMMGEMDGLELAKELRAQGTDSKIIMMTGYADADTKHKAEAAGVDVFLEKPITAKGFLEAVGKALA